MQGGGGSQAELLISLVFQQHFYCLSGGSDNKESARNAGDPDLIAGSRKIPWRSEWLSLQYSCLENSIENPGGL